MTFDEWALQECGEQYPSNIAREAWEQQQEIIDAQAEELAALRKDLTTLGHLHTVHFAKAAWAQAFVAAMVDGKLSPTGAAEEAYTAFMARFGAAKDDV